ncbi:hypothetical protein EV401DRAFT_1907052, partial [Pisolithus croceorrhizus]
VFALLSRHPWVSHLLGCLILAEIDCCMTAILSGFKSFASDILYQLSPEVNIQMAFTTIVHSALPPSTVAKLISTVGARGIERNVISQFTCNGTVTYFMVTGLMGLGLATSTVRDLKPIYLFFWALTGSRLISGMVCMQDHIRALWQEENILLTTNIDICLSEDLD